jgi:IclR family acetate operon transcriptional repressor
VTPWLGTTDDRPADGYGPLMSTVSARSGRPNRTRSPQVTTRRRIIGSVDDSREPRTRGRSPELPPGVRSLRRGLDVLEAMADAGGEVSLRQLSRRLQLAESTVHGLLQTLVLSGHVRQTPERRYALGHALIRLGEASNRKLALRAAPTLRRLAEIVEVNADLAVLEGTDAVYVAQAVVARLPRSSQEVERRLPAVTTAAGRVLLSQLPPAEIDLFVRRHLMSEDGVAPRLDRFLAGLARVRSHGYAIETDEVEAGISCLALPVPRAPIPLALTVTGPSSRLTVDHMLSLRPQVHQTAERLAAEL